MEVLDDPAATLANDFRVLAGEVRRIEGKIADHATAENDPHLVETANGGACGSLVREFEGFAQVEAP